MDTTLELLHIVAAVFIVGPMAILPMTGLRALRAREAGPITVLAKSVNLFTLLSLLVALFGFGALGMSERASFASTWIWLSIVLYAIALGINLFLVVPALRTAAEEVTANASGTARLAVYPRIAAGSGIVTLLLVGVTVLMVLRP
ncbi:DUF2269 family protein [Cryobacterium sp. SO1]|uniref:DUF2269 family protein n=1 Tax=Cryobacterium sp. SO1 TaxID=1897061 RepID=UPI001022B7F6|nr:DUF2269 family protein [Cryobacterium sp. SO1]RZI35705.1 hypothetical protein BJQ95_01936 [Cryobacterium sp. SO1]